MKTKTVKIVTVLASGRIRVRLSRAGRIALAMHIGGKRLGSGGPGLSEVPLHEAMVGATLNELMLRTNAFHLVQTNRPLVVLRRSEALALMVVLGDATNMELMNVKGELYQQLL